MLIICWLWQVWNACRRAYPSRHLVPSLFGLAYAWIVLTSFPELALFFLHLSPLISLGTFKILLQTDKQFLYRKNIGILPEFHSKTGAGVQATLTIQKSPCWQVFNYRFNSLDFANTLQASVIDRLCSIKPVSYKNKILIEVGAVKGFENTMQLVPWFWIYILPFVSVPPRNTMSNGSARRPDSIEQIITFDILK